MIEVVGTQPRQQPTAELETLVRAVTDIAATANRQPSRVSVRFGCAAIDVEWPLTSQAPVPASQHTESGRDDRYAVCAPLVGTFYCAPEPGAPPFVDIGDIVHAGQQVAVLEAMKLMNPLEADRSGIVVDIMVADAQPVEYGQPLIMLAPLEE